jgi:hypothetical protein
VVVAGNQEV